MQTQGHFLVTAIRSGGSIFGAAMAPVRENGEIVRYATLDEADAAAQRYRDGCSSRNVAYVIDTVDCWRTLIRD